PDPPDRSDTRRPVDREVLEVPGAQVGAVGPEPLQPVEVEVEDLALLVVGVALVVLAAVGDDVEAGVGHVLDGQRHGVAVEGPGLEAGELRRLRAGEREDLPPEEHGPRVGADDGGGQELVLEKSLHCAASSGGAFGRRRPYGRVVAATSARRDERAPSFVRQGRPGSARSRKMRNMRRASSSSKRRSWSSSSSPPRRSRMTRIRYFTDDGWRWRSSAAPAGLPPVARYACSVSASSPPKRGSSRRGPRTRRT